MKKDNNILQFEQFSQFPQLLHGFSTRAFGSMHSQHTEFPNSLRTFAASLTLSFKEIVLMQQVHGSTVTLVSQSDQGERIAQTDGLVTNEQHIFLGVVVADCVPILLFDSKQKLVACAHAGWRGLTVEIIKEAVFSMLTKGSRVDDLLVGIGPCIGVCCYTIEENHKEMLLSTLPAWKDFIEKRERQWFLDLAGVARYQLESLGVLSHHIESMDYCTFTHADMFSYRRERKKGGGIIGIIGMR
jgi:polyphenol oxidase